MTQEDKQLLLQDICGRLPYGVMFLCGNNIYVAKGIDLLLTDECEREYHVTSWSMEPVELKYIKPYLRPMSSMTEEEKKSLPFPWVYNFGAITSYCESEGFIEIRDYECSCIIEWLNAHHFDYRGLIQKGLAISTEEFNPYKD